MKEGKIPLWYAFGVSHKKADLQLRARFTLSQDEINHYYQDIFKRSCTAGFILSTCNRTSFFLYGGDPEKVEAHFASQKTQTPEDYNVVSYCYKNKEAVQHMFEVAAGLDSQIPGDFEIIGQMKKAATYAKTFGVLSGEMEKLMNAVTYASRRIKNETKLSSGTCSFSFATVRLLKDQFIDLGARKILILGLGEIGRQILENLLKHKEAENIWVCNRSEEKARQLADEYGVQVLPFFRWKNSLHQFDAMVNAASSPVLLLNDQEIKETASLSLLLDLAVPPALGNTQGNKVVYHVDEISAFVKGSIGRRLMEIPKAQYIVSEVMQDFFRWQAARTASPYVFAIGEVLESRLAARQKHHSVCLHQRRRLQARLFQSVKHDPQRLISMQSWVTKWIA